MKKNKKNLGLYIHVPFCVQKCAYCDFYSLSDHHYMDEYTHTIQKNIADISKSLDEYSIDTIFFGGGTPSLLGSHNFRELCDCLYASLNISDCCELSVEVNPATVSAELANTFKSCGVNRVSIGLQSSQNGELKCLSRIHTYDDFLRTYSLVNQYVTDNINIDIMYGIPDQNINSLEKTLSDVLLLAPKHISAYGLKIEPSTPFAQKRDNLILPDEDVQSAMYHLICTTLAKAGLQRYEISNFAIPGYECKHNIKYWNREEYVGLGPSAHSFFNGKRFSFGRDLKKYIDMSYNPSELIYDEFRTITELDSYNEKIMLGLRLEKGILPDREILQKAEIYCNSGFMIFDGERLRFTTKGFLVSNFILSELIE